MSSKKPTIGFGRAAMPNEAEGAPTNEQQEPAPRPTRQPKAAPEYVGTVDGLEILGAYGLTALTPLSNLEQQLLQVIAGLEKRITELE